MAHNTASATRIATTSETSPSAHGFTLSELRAALDDFELRGQPARAALVDVVGRMPAEGGAPELARAQELLAERA